MRLHLKTMAVPLTSRGTKNEFPRGHSLRAGKSACRLLALALVCTAPLSHADVDPYRLYLAERGEIPWQSLSPEEQDALKQHRRQWDSYSGERQERMRQGAQRYLDLPPDKQREVERRRREYEQLPSEERRRLREEYKRHRD